jgi:NTP pyrophosphatase (non-canonical NTP hydrolase)
MEKHQFLAICSWQRNTFGDATALSKLHHLHQELVELHTELKHATNGSDDAIKKEFADCFILLFGAADSYGLSYEDICSAIDNKMSINYKIVWGKPDQNGVVNHINQ